MAHKGKRVIFIVGPTASGKTAEAVRQAIRLKTCIISADSRQVYSDMRIGTARPTEEEMNLVEHHLVGFLPLSERFSAGDFARRAREILTQKFSSNNTVIVAGGSGLYLHALLHGMDDLPFSEEVRQELNSIQERSGTAMLAERLKNLDPNYAAICDLRNSQRVIRALEVCIAAGVPYSTFLGKSNTALPYEIKMIGLTHSRQLLYERINERVDQMIRQGLEDEARILYPQRNLNALKTVGYREWHTFFEGVVNSSGVVNLIKQNTRNFAKRQLTWFNKDKSISWFDPKDTMEIDRFIDSTTN